MPTYQQPTSGQDYNSLGQNNPYRNFKYTKTFWDRLGDRWNQMVGEDNLFTVRTGEQKYRDEMENLARGYDAQLAETQREEMYNSADEQAQRFRAAGINPDLEGSQIGAGEAAPFDNQANMQLPDQSNEALQAAGNIVTQIMGIPSTVMSLVNQGIDIAQKNAQTPAVRAQTFTQLNELAQEAILDYWTNEGKPEFWSADGRLKPDYKRSLISRLMNDPRLKAAFPMSRSRKQFVEHMLAQNGTLSTMTKGYDMLGQYKASKFNPMNTDDNLVRTMMSWTAQYNKLQLEYLKRYQEKLNNTNDPENKAGAESLDHQLTRMRLEGMKVLIDSLHVFFGESNDKAYMYAISIAEQIYNGEITRALKLSTIPMGKGLLGFFGKPQNSNNQGNENPVDPTSSTPVPSSGAGTPNGDNTVAPSPSRSSSSGSGSSSTTNAPSANAAWQKWLESLFGTPASGGFGRKQNGQLRKLRSRYGYNPFLKLYPNGFEAPPHGTRELNDDATNHPRPAPNRPLTPEELQRMQEWQENHLEYPD